MQQDNKKRNIALLVLGTGILMFVLMMIFVLPYFMSEKKYGEMQAALNGGDYNSVFRIADFLLSQNPTSVQAYYFRGQAFLAKKKYIAAEHDLEQVIEINAQYSNLRSVSVQLGEIYHQHGLVVISSQPEKARRIFMKALKYLPREINLKHDLATASYNLGRSFEGENESAATVYFEEAVAYHPEKPLYKLYLGRNLVETTRTEEAIALINEAIKKDTTLKTQKNIDILKNALWKVAQAKERDYYLGKIDDASTVIALFDNIIAYDGSNKEVLLEKFALAENTGNFTVAKDVLNSISSQGMFSPIKVLNLLVQLQAGPKPKALFTENDKSPVGLKLDSELAWSADGSKIIVKAADKSSNNTKVVKINTADGTNSILASEYPLSWEGKIFTPAEDGIFITSKDALYHINDNSALEKATSLRSDLLDISRDGKGLLLTSKGKNYRYDMDKQKRTSFYIGGLRGGFKEAVYSPQNKRIAALAGDDVEQTLGVDLGKGNSKILAKGNLSSLRWSPDGKTVYYLNSQNNLGAVYSAVADGKTPPQAVTKPEVIPTSFELSPTGSKILYKGLVEKETLWLLDEVGALKTVTPRFGEIGSFIWSPDGKKIAYLFSPIKDGPVTLETIDVVSKVEKSLGR